MSFVPPFDPKKYFQDLMEGGSEPPISIFAVMEENKFIVGFPTRAQAEGYLKADKRKLTIREGSFPTQPRHLDMLRIGRLPPKLGPPVPRSPSPYMRDVVSKLGADRQDAKIDTSYDAANREWVFKNEDGLEVRVPKHTMMKEYS